VLLRAAQRFEMMVAATAPTASRLGQTRSSYLPMTTVPYRRVPLPYFFFDYFDGRRK
jgi:hypothetical protein